MELHSINNFMLDMPGEEVFSLKISGLESDEEEEEEAVEMTHSPLPLMHSPRPRTRRRNPWKGFLKRVRRVLAPILPREGSSALTVRWKVTDEEHTQVTLVELFYDLIFVAAAIELAGYLKDNITPIAILRTFEVFASLWITWFHLNMLLTRFRLGFPWSIGVFCVSLGTMLIAVHSDDNKGTGSDPVNSGFDGSLTRQIFFSLLITRLTFMVLYTLIYYTLPEGRYTFSIYAWVFVVSTLLALICAVVDDLVVSTALWPIALLLESFMYSFELYVVDFHLPINVGHILERNQLWVILIIGESIVAIVTSPHPGGFHAEYYVSIVLAFYCIYVLTDMYIGTQLEIDVSFEKHAIEKKASHVLFNVCQLLITAGLLGMGTGIKLAVSHVADHEYKRKYALLLTGSLAFALLAMNVSRATHKWGDHTVLGSKRGTYVVWALHMVVSGLLPLLALGVGTSEDSGPVRVPHLFALLAVFITVLALLELTLRPKHDEPTVEVLQTQAHINELRKAIDTMDLNVLSGRHDSLADLRVLGGTGDGTPVSLEQLRRHLTSRQQSHHISRHHSHISLPRPEADAQSHHSHHTPHHTPLQPDHVQQLRQVVIESQQQQKERRRRKPRKRCDTILSVPSDGDTTYSGSHTSASSSASYSCSTSSSRSRSRSRSQSRSRSVSADSRSRSTSRGRGRRKSQSRSRSRSSSCGEGRQQQQRRRYW
eukprot:m.49889 g.49889  ORF g.49889 m.49889 type:complete len:711 (-) comp15089_c1_seq1:708-2840(-)